MVEDLVDTTTDTLADLEQINEAIDRIEAHVSSDNDDEWTEAFPISTL